MPTSRREFAAQLLRSVMALGLLEVMGSRAVGAAGARTSLAAWFEAMAAWTRELRAGRIDGLEFQGEMEALFRRVDLPDLASFIALDELERRLQAPARGAAARDLDLRAALPGGVGFTARIFVCRKGRAIVPHGHVGMCSGFLVLRGRWRGRHYDRVATEGEHHLIRPTIDRSFAPGDLSTISDDRDNVHWFAAESDTAWIFNVHVSGLDPGAPRAGRLYLDPAGERLAGGLIRAPMMTPTACQRKYGGPDGS